MRRCAHCDKPISAARLAACPNTHLCVPCKSWQDEPKLKSDAPVLRGVLVETSIGDLEEMQKAAREMAAGE